MRESIEATYDSRETGDRFTVETTVNGRRIKEETIPDPFINTTIVIGWKDVVRALFGGNRVRVGCHVRGDSQIIEDVLELDANYIGHQSTRRQRFQQLIETALSRLACTPAGEELN